MTKTSSIIPYAVIKSAALGDAVAMVYVLDHFGSYINRLARKTFFDDSGVMYAYVDQEMKRRLEIKLMVSILNFEIEVT